MPDRATKTGHPRSCQHGSVGLYRRDLLDVTAGSSDVVVRERHLELRPSVDDEAIARHRLTLCMYERVRAQLRGNRGLDLTGPIQHGTGLEISDLDQALSDGPDEVRSS